MGRRHRSRRSRTRSRSRSYYGGAGGVEATASPSMYSSAASWMNAINGTADSQYGRVFNQNSPYPPNGNAIIGIQGQRAGRRRRHRRSRRHRRTRRGGTMGALGTAIVPAALVGLHHVYGRRTRKH